MPVSMCMSTSINTDINMNINEGVNMDIGILTGIHFVMRLSRCYKSRQDIYGNMMHMWVW